MEGLLELGCQTRELKNEHGWPVGKADGEKVQFQSGTQNEGIGDILQESKDLKINAFLMEHHEKRRS